MEVRRSVAPAPVETRNSIGVAVTPAKSATTGNEQMPKPTVPKPIAVPAVDRSAIVRPVATASIPDRGKIDGSRLIRPSVAPTGLGGPAKFIAGINGTTFREKR